MSYSIQFYYNEITSKNLVTTIYQNNNPIGNITCSSYTCVNGKINGTNSLSITNGSSNNGQFNLNGSYNTIDPSDIILDKTFVIQFNLLGIIPTSGTNSYQYIYNSSYIYYNGNYVTQTITFDEINPNS